MTGPHQPALATALDLVEEHDTWQALRAALEAAGLVPALGPAGLEVVLGKWQERAAWRLDDAVLAAEIAHWAGGGGYGDHLQGFNAIRPAALVAEAERRGWFVRRLASGVLVNPPGRKPLALKSL